MLNIKKGYLIGFKIQFSIIHLPVYYKNWFVLMFCCASNSWQFQQNISCKPCKATGQEKKNIAFKWFTETFLCCWFVLPFSMEVERTERCSGSVRKANTGDAQRIFGSSSHHKSSSYGKQLDPNSRPSSSDNNMKNIILSNARGLIQPLIAVERYRRQKSLWLQCML